MDAVLIHRKILNWCWFWKDNMLQLFIYLLLTANHEDTKVGDTDVPCGSILTTYKNVSRQTRMPYIKAYRSIKKLESTGEISVESFDKYVIIKITNFGTYQSDGVINLKQFCNKTVMDNIVESRELQKKVNKTVTELIQNCNQTPFFQEKETEKETVSPTPPLKEKDKEKEYSHQKSKKHTESMLKKKKTSLERNQEILSSLEGIDTDYARFVRWVHTVAFDVIFAKMLMPNEPFFLELKRQYGSQQIADVINDMTNAPKRIKDYVRLGTTLKNWLKIRNRK